jgi:hypothetical protein
LPSGGHEEGTHAHRMLRSMARAPSPQADTAAAVVAADCSSPSQSRGSPPSQPSTPQGAATDSHTRMPSPRDWAKRVKQGVEGGGTADLRGW